MPHFPLPKSKFILGFVIYVEVYGCILSKYLKDLHESSFALHNYYGALLSVLIMPLGFLDYSDG